MASLRNQRVEWEWPAELGTFDSRRWSSRAEWHLARSHAAPSRLVALREIRASVGVESGGVVDDGAVWSSCRRPAPGCGDDSRFLRIGAHTITPVRCCSWLRVTPAKPPVGT